jgi:hypothetical protein
VIDDRGPLRRGDFAQRKYLSTPKIGDHKSRIEDHKTDYPPAQDGSRVNSNLAARLDSCQRIIALPVRHLALGLLQSARVGDLTPVPPAK